MCRHCNVFIRIPWKPSDSKKTANGGIHHKTCAKRHLKGACNEEVRALSLHSLQGSKDRDATHDEEAKEKVEEFHLESGA